ncbi:uncharacterized protein LOC124500442 [Dermatophagoides farinae]|uniref:uncharacterized protein LOC124500442 n=1 Tax=Dermatophagoides farinae TaxID=6954 RepID=UPI001F0E7D78|nr:probable serine/threonine-protein kinase smg1 [Dermatophagoides farinae]
MKNTVSQMSQSPLYHRITQKILVIGPSGCGKTSLIESILSCTNCPYQYHRQQSLENNCENNEITATNKNNNTNTTVNNNIIKQCCYSQTVQFREIEIQLKVFERTCNGQLDRSTIQPYYHSLDAIIGVYDWTNYQQSFHQMRDALDSILALYNNDDDQQQRPTVFVLGNVRDHRRCRQCGPCREVKEYVEQIGAIQLFNYCYSSRHIKAFHHVFMLNIYRQHFCQQLTETFEKAINNCRKHVYHQMDSSYQSSTLSSLSNLKNLFKRIKIPNYHHHHHHHHHNHHHHNHHHHSALQA